ncbi:phosphatidylserine/phosphatidylglycerophosphate/cardiolipin synthase family protein [Candidatus Dependentiae bacterium]
MRIYKKLLGICIFMPFFYASIFSCSGPQKHFYKKNFIVDSEQHCLENIIKLEKLEKNVVRTAFFSPNDDALGIILGLIDNENSSIKIATFFLTEDKIVDALIRAINRGIAVDLVAGSYVLSGKYSVGAKKLEAAGANIYAYSPPTTRYKWIRGIMHNKFIVFGQNIYQKPLVLTGSFNLTHSAHTYNKENFTIFDNERLVNLYDKRFDYLKHNHCQPYVSIENILKNKDGKIRNAFFTPNNNVLNILVSVINEEQLSIKMAVFYLTKYDIVDALLNAMKRGVMLDIVAGTNVVSGKYDDGARKLAAKGANIYAYEPTEGIQHNKFMVFGKNIENKPLVCTGSLNPTNSAFTYNKENIIITENGHLVKQYNDRFEFIKKKTCTVYKPIKRPRGRRKKVPKKKKKVPKKKAERVPEKKKPFDKLRMVGKKKSSILGKRKIARITNEQEEQDFEQAKKRRKFAFANN